MRLKYKSMFINMSARIVGRHPAPDRDGCGSDGKPPVKPTLQCNGNQKDFRLLRAATSSSSSGQSASGQDERSKVRDGRRFGTATSSVTCADARSQRPKELYQVLQRQQTKETLASSKLPRHKKRKKKFLFDSLPFSLVSFVRVSLVGSRCLLSRIKLKSIKVDILRTERHAQARALHAAAKQLKTSLNSFAGHLHRLSSPLSPLWAHNSRAPR
jgi:hypothetical protein